MKPTDYQKVAFVLAVYELFGATLIQMLLLLLLLLMMMMMMMMMVMTTMMMMMVMMMMMTMTVMVMVNDHDDYNDVDDLHFYELTCTLPHAMHNYYLRVHKYSSCAL